MRLGLRDISHIDHERYMQLAIEEAIIAGERGDKAIGAVLVHNDKVIGKMGNACHTKASRVHHAENALIIDNGYYLNKYGPDCIIYTTLEPCIMCIGTIIMANIRNIVVGFEDKYMQTEEFIAASKYLKDRIFNYLVGVKREECRDLIVRYGEERDKKILL